MLENMQHGPPDSADLLADVVARTTYKPGWTIRLSYMQRWGEHLAGGEGLTLSVRLESEDSTTPGQTTRLHHLFAVPPAAYNRETWERWVLDCIIQVETHEALEWFKVDGQAPYFPAHGTQNGHNPYTIQRRHHEDGLPGAPVYSEAMA